MLYGPLCLSIEQSRLRQQIRYIKKTSKCKALFSSHEGACWAKRLIDEAVFCHVDIPVSSLDVISESSSSICLIRLDNFPAFKLLIGVGGPDQLASCILGNSQGGKAVIRVKLAAPARADAKLAAFAGASVAVRGVVGLHEIGAMGNADAAVDAKGPGAGGIFLVADALHVLDSPVVAGDRDSKD